MNAPSQDRRDPGQPPLRLHINEGARPDAGWLALDGDALTSTLRHYPDRTALETALAARLETAPDRVLVTAGADDAIQRCCDAFLRGGRSLVVATPTFRTMLRLAEQAGGTIEGVDWPGGTPYPIQRLLETVSPRTGIVAVISPDNPTGRTVDRRDVERLARRLPDDALLLLDQAYIEYGGDDWARWAEGRANVAVVRTLSKAWGLAGCRCGYLIGEAALVRDLRDRGNPFPVAGASLAVAERAIRTGGERMTAHVARVRDERAELERRLDAHGVPAAGSRANFVWAPLGRRTAFVHRALASLGVLVRRFEEAPEISDHLRISLPDDAEGMRRLSRALDVTLAPQAVLFDMDGVLADAAPSYRAAVVETARHFGVEVTRQDVQRAVEAGDANNDWVLTQRLLAAAGVEVSLAEVTAVFQDLYLGAGDRTGLRERERALVTAEQLAGLRDVRSIEALGIVTGRPRDEAEWFLTRHGLDGTFDTLVAMEDGPNKPDPAPVRVALERLAVDRAWMIGDTPDDVRAARAAGVVPLGVVAPGDDPASARPNLLQSGAAVVLDGTLAVKELLS